MYSKVPSQRQLRVAEQVRQALSQSFARADFYIPDLKGVYITVTEVSLSPDLKNAIAYIIPMGNNDNELIIKVLNKNSGKFKHYISKNVEMRTHPKIVFKLDTAFDYADQIDSILNKVKK